MLHAIYLRGLLFFWILIPLTVFSQQDFITGQLLDNEDGAPIVFATIRVKNKNVGVISNLDGSFRIPNKFKNLGSVLEISSLGYVSKDILLYELSINKTNIIGLFPAIEVLDEVIVEGVMKRPKRIKTYKKMSAVDIVGKAIANISLNYPSSPFTSVGYYRDFQMNDKRYFNLNEALFEVWDQGFGASDFETTKVRIFEYKRSQDFPTDSIAQKPYDYKNRNKTMPGAYLKYYGGNEFTILRIHDAIRNNSIDLYDYVNVFRTDFLKNHLFKKEADVILNNKKLFNISFLRNIGLFEVKGNLFISQENLAIYKMEYTINSSYREKLRYSRRYYKNRPKELLFSIVVSYAPVDGFMYPNYHSMKNNFKVKESPKFKVNEVSYNLNQKCFYVYLNNKANEKDALKKSNYRLKYKGKKIKINKIVLIEDEVILFLDPDTITAKLMFDEITVATKKDIQDEDILNIKIENIRDVHGNYINEPSYRAVKQYREFFVQQILTNPKVAPNDSLYMNMNLPIYKNQPIAKPEFFSDYWMNTPLPNLDE